jgi:phage repressor protein C with HTH and peptisase S24 domain
MQKQKTIGMRLREAFKHLGLSIAEVAKITGIPYPTLQDYLNDKRTPGGANLQKISMHLHISIDWLLTGQGPMFREEDKSRVKPPPNAKIIEITNIPVVAKVGAGFPHLNFDDIEVLYYIPFPAESAPKNAFAVEVNGDSMEPLLQEGDIVVCQPFSGLPVDIPNSKIVVIANSWGELLIKRIQKFISPDYQQVKIIFYSDNPKYPPIEPEKEHEEYRIIGIAIELVQRKKL